MPLTERCIMETTTANLYRLLKRIASAAPEPDLYDVMLTSARADGSTYEHRSELRASDKVQVPWDIPGKVFEVRWYPVSLQDPSVFVKVSVDEFNGGIYVLARDWLLADWRRHVIGIEGIIRLRRDCIAVADEDAVIAKVVDLINDDIDAIIRGRDNAFSTEGEEDLLFNVYTEN